ncbi:MAG TPA: PIG-L deacetylase family protein [Ktedonobacteraceae bacterium]|nr:PIG-L deacetylase family protein [Ktedonobacteraceae bacterium]
MTSESTTSSVLLPPGGQRILVIMAHPDDAEFICGGTIARLTAERCDVFYVLVTSGNRGSQEAGMTMERLAQIREEEQRRAAETLGVREVMFLGHNDGEVEVTLALRSELAYAIRRFQPDVLFTFDPWRPYEIHPDHRNVGMCALDALAAARMPMYYPEQLTGDMTQHRLKQVYLFSTHQPNHWVDISDTIEKKLEALHCHTSQVSASVDEIIRQRASLAGVEHGYKYSESFHHMALR